MSSDPTDDARAVPPPLPGAEAPPGERPGSPAEPGAEPRSAPATGEGAWLQPPGSPVRGARSAHENARLGPTLLVLFGVIPFANLLGVLALAIAGLASRSSSGAQTKSLDAFLRDLASSPDALWYLILPVQLGYLAAGIVPALLSPTPFLERLGLVRPRLAWTTWLLVLAGQIGLQLVITTVFTWLVDEPSESLQELARMISSLSGSQAWILYAMIALLPGVGEELVFRGYVQTRLQRALPAWRAIVLVAAVFTLAHMDPQHMAGVFPIALYLGFVRWATGSTWVTIACHVLNNAFGILLESAVEGEAAAGASVPYLVAVALFGLCTVLAVLDLRRRRVDPPGPVVG